MEFTYNKEQKFIQVQTPKNFDFNIVNAFFDVFRDSSSDLHSIDIDMSHTDYADSAALGMVLHIIQEYPDTSIRLLNVKPKVYRVFYIARFQDMIQILPQGQHTEDEQNQLMAA
ncbi:STAS domain-containing protein [Opacimonas viscosa]|uniref:STAS domain-containing protein n=1 Tax=Opacimonas viscosa TaxID=2961944 RepID=A0AA41X3V1_9ALTE|nr:STAS domain-containing protein [Opacimonas viscosa]MCP3428099.1 STAS domain-containing protein [Opacimonas viscosa]